MLVTGDRVGGTAASLGYSVFTPGTGHRSVSHETEEVAYVVSGRGRLRLDDGEVAFAQRRRAPHPAPGSGTRSSNTGDEDVVMVFGFPHPDYPPTERR